MELRLERVPEELQGPGIGYLHRIIDPVKLVQQISYYNTVRVEGLVVTGLRAENQHMVGVLAVQILQVLDVQVISLGVEQVRVVLFYLVPELVGGASGLSIIQINVIEGLLINYNYLFKIKKYLFKI